MVEAGMTAEEAKKRFVVCTSKGTLGAAGRKALLQLL